MAHECMFYAIVQKDGLGFDKAVEEAKARMARYNVTPNMLVCPPQLLLYMALAPEEKIKFNEAGPSGPATFEAGVAGFHFPCLTDRAWTKREVADALGASDAMLDTTQVYAGLLVLRRTPTAEALLERAIARGEVSA